jgi:hypothetical protein
MISVAMADVVIIYLCAGGVTLSLNQALTIKREILYILLLHWHESGKWKKMEVCLLCIRRDLVKHGSYLIM